MLALLLDLKELKFNLLCLYVRYMNRNEIPLVSPHKLIFKASIRQSKVNKAIQSRGATAVR